MCIRDRSQDKVVLCVASSSIVAQNLTGGTTAHSLFRLHLFIRDVGFWSITNGTQRAELIREATLLNFDEAAMAVSYTHLDVYKRQLEEEMK